MDPQYTVYLLDNDVMLSRVLLSITLSVNDYRTENTIKDYRTENVICDVVEVGKILCGFLNRSSGGST